MSERNAWLCLLGTVLIGILLMMSAGCANAQEQAKPNGVLVTFYWHKDTLGVFSTQIVDNISDIKTESDIELITSELKKEHKTKYFQLVTFKKLSGVKTIRTKRKSLFVSFMYHKDRVIMVNSAYCEYNDIGTQKGLNLVTKKIEKEMGHKILIMDWIKLEAE